MKVGKRFVKIVENTGYACFHLYINMICSHFVFKGQLSYMLLPKALYSHLLELGKVDIILVHIQ